MIQEENEKIRKMKVGQWVTKVKLEILLGK